MFNFSRHEDYHHVPEEEENKSLMSDPSSSLESISYTRPGPRSPSLWLASMLLLVSSILTCILGLWIGRRFPNNLDATCTKHVSKYCRYHYIVLHQT
jgi:hypothetical protein